MYLQLLKIDETTKCVLVNLFQLIIEQIPAKVKQRFVENDTSRMSMFMSPESRGILYTGC